MKFSLLLPTRNRLDLLRYAVATVQDQSHADWEIVIADNASDDDICGYVAGLGDARIRYVRSDAFLPVTDNWNRALEASTGDYVLMLGDDDCLLPGCLATMQALIERHAYPDLVYTEALQYAYPGVIPSHPEPFTQVGYCAFMRPGDAAYLLSRAEALAVVRESFEFRIAFSYNMQHSLVSRRMVERLAAGGAFYRSPYPDYYATNALFLLAETILVHPRPAVVIGISPKSFGYFYFNAAQTQGVQFLNNMQPDDISRRVEEQLLPGSDMNTCWLLAMEAVKDRVPTRGDLEPSYWRYRHMQLTDQFMRRTSTTAFLRQLFGEARPAELARWLGVLALSRVSPGRANDLVYRIHRSHPLFDARRERVSARNVLELYEARRAGTAVAA
jgi:glycosyltransferase involved in cell wall biosynthesis